MVDPIDVLAMDEIATHTGIDIRPVLIGPSTIDEAIEDLYGISSTDSTELADDVLSSFDDFDVQGMMDQVMDDEQWDELFDDEEDVPSVEDSAILSRDMRDRPSTDVLAGEEVDAAVEEADREALEESFAEEDLVEIEIIEELDKPIDFLSKTDEYSLSEWQVDEAIGGPGDSEILSADRAEMLFSGEPTGEQAALDIEVEPIDDAALTAVSEAEELLDDTQSSGTSIGVSIDHLEDGVLGGEALADVSEAEESSRTQIGVGTRAAEELATHRTESTDYGALGRAILKSKTGSEAEDEPADEAGDEPADEAGDEPADEAGDDTDTGVHAADDADTNVRETGEDASVDSSPKPAKPRSGGVHTREIDSDVLDALTRDSEDIPGLQAGADPRDASPQTDIIDPAVVKQDRPREIRRSRQLTRPRLLSPQGRLPEGVDVEGLVLALANLLISKEILTLDEVFQLAQQLTPEE
jgi:hypothetical protein